MKPRLTYSPALGTWCCHGDGLTACAPPLLGFYPRAFADLLNRKDAYKAWSTLRAERFCGLQDAPATPPTPPEQGRDSLDDFERFGEALIRDFLKS